MQSGALYRDAREPLRCGALSWYRRNIGDTTGNQRGSVIYPRISVSASNPTESDPTSMLLRVE